MFSASRAWNTNSKRLAALFLMVLVPSAVTLIWLGVKLLEQDRKLWADRDLERREAAVEIFVRSIGQTLASAERAFDGGPVPEGAVLAHVNATSVIVRPPNGVLWTPAPPRMKELNEELFADAEIAEAQKTGDRGYGFYSSLSRDPDHAVRAGALSRLARVHLASADVPGAIRHYRELASLPEAAVNGTPADLFARRQICELMKESGDTASLTREANSLRMDLVSGRWVLDQSSWELAAEDIERWTGRAPETSDEQRALTKAVDWLWQQEHGSDQNGDDAARELSGRRVDNIHMLLRRQTTRPSLEALLIPPSVVRSWVLEAMPKELAPIDSLILTDEAGTIVVGTKAETGSRMVMRFGSETGLPWNVALKPPSGVAADPELETRRWLLSAGLGAIVILLGGGGYLAWRTVKRELAVARMQTDFVAAVSHEFRTPLTSMQHVTELLQEDDELPASRRQLLYSALSKGTERLRGLVESLLDFSRMEDERKPYNLQPLDPAPFVKRLVEEFERHASGETILIPELPEPGALSCRADAEALGHALWNLLDNAVKYSPSPHHVQVSVRRLGGEVAIAVADRGFGIPLSERQSVFRKFVRGSETLRRGIKGTGLGLAIVAYIVAAHRGRIELDSEEGRGSTFTILLPGV